MKFLLVVLGVIGGFGVGYVTRPTILGVQLPIELLSSDNPFDAEPKSMLMSHLLTTSWVGLVVGIALAVLATMIAKPRNG